MKKNQVFVLLALAVVLGLAGVYFQLSKSEGWNNDKTDRRIFPNLPINDAVKIQIRSGATSVTLEKKQDKWGVAERNDFPADFEKIRDLTRNLWELKAARAFEIGASQLARLKLLDPGQEKDSGIEIRLQGDNDKNIASLILGKTLDQGEDGARGIAGRFVYNPATKDRAYLVSDGFASIEPLTVGSWLDKTFITPGELQAVEQSAWSNNKGWKIVRDSPKADWKLQDPQAGETLDNQFAQAAAHFAPSFIDVRPASVSTDETGLNAPFRLELKNFDGFKYDISIGKAGPEKARFVNFQVSAEIKAVRSPEPNESPDDKKKRDEEFDKRIAGLRQRLEEEKRLEKWVYLVPDWSLEYLLKRRDEILAKPSPTPAASSPASGPADGTAPALAPAASPVSPTSTSSAPSAELPISPSPTPGSNAEKTGDGQ
jgi:hypothetical protein